MSHIDGGPADIAARLTTLLGPNGWWSSTETSLSYRDWLDRYGEVPLGIARPASTQEASRVLELCHRNRIAVVPQGGNTSLCGAAVHERAGGVILSLSRMATVEAVDATSGSVTVGAGLVLAALHDALDGSGLMFPMHLGAEGSAQVGGLIATNAGGSLAFRYGMMGDLVLGLEVVLPDGTVWNGLRAVQKDNAGYQLRRLFCGSEGTLGVVTRAVLKLFAVPANRVTALLSMPDLAAAVEFGTRVRAEAGDFLSALEFFSEQGMRLAEKHLPAISLPLETRGDVYLLVEAASTSRQVPLEDIVGASMEWGMEQGLVLDGALAASEAQRGVFWRLREEIPEGQRLEGAQLKHDIAVPPGRIAAFVVEADALCKGLLADVRINPFGHLADGNIHYNLSPPEGRSDFAGHDRTIAMALARLASDMGGSFAAEHGLGRSKIDLADTLRPAAERSLMRSIKDAIDPAWQVNPGVVVRQLPS